MALTVTHSTPADGTFSAAGQAAWNASHSISGGVPSDVGLGNVTNDVQTKAAIVPNTAPTNGQLLIGHTANGNYSVATLTQGSGITITNGAGSITIAASGSSTWDTIGAAAADGSTNNGTNRIVYNVAPTADSRIAWRFTESSAATNGTSTSGVPNQVLLQLDTLASSTQSPLKVLSRGSFVFAVSPTNTQILAASSSGAGPSYSFAAQTGHGWGAGASYIGGYVSGALVYLMLSGQMRFPSGSVGTPAIVDTGGATSGLSWPTTDEFAVSIAGVENTRWTAGVARISNASANATSYAINARKSRGTVASPTVITTGDDLLTISGYGYVGATNTYREAARITFDSTGTISDATNGIGGIIRFSTQLQGTDTSPQERWRIEQAGWLVGQEFATDPGTTVLTAGADFAMYRKNDKLVFAHNVTGTINYLSIPLDGSTTTWTQNTTAP